MLTKPLGTQVAVNAHQWLDRGKAKYWDRIKGVITEEEGMRWSSPQGGVRWEELERRNGEGKSMREDRAYLCAVPRIMP